MENKVFKSHKLYGEQLLNTNGCFSRYENMVCFISSEINCIKDLQHLGYRENKQLAKL